MSSVNFDTKIQPITVQPANVIEPTSSVFSTQNTIIIILSVLLILSFLGINLLDILSNIIKSIADILGPVVTKFLSLIGFTTGTVLNTSADVVSDTSKLAIDIAEGSIQDIGNLLIKASKRGTASSSLNNSLSAPVTADVPLKDISEDPIQKPISAAKQNWCLIGEFDNKRKCVPMVDFNKCMSGKIFDNEQSCLSA